MALIRYEGSSNKPQQQAQKVGKPAAYGRNEKGALKVL